MGEETIFTVTDRTGEMRTIPRGGFVVVEDDCRHVCGFHVWEAGTDRDGTVTCVKGDGLWFDTPSIRFVTPTGHPRPGRIRVAGRRTGMWLEADARDVIPIGNGYWRCPHLPPVNERDYRVEGSPAVIIPRIRTFGRLERDDWLAVKQREESDELLDAAGEWLSAPSAEHRRVMLDELADLLQTIGNMCVAYRIDVRDIADALDRCWEKNMHREQPGAGSAESMLIRRGISPNATVRDRGTGRTLTVLPSDTWGRRLDTGKVGVYETDWRRPEWLPFTRLEPVEDGEGRSDD